MRSHHDHGAICFDQAYKCLFNQNLECVQYNACLGITGAIGCTSKECFYQELDLKSLQLRRWS